MSEESFLRNCHFVVKPEDSHIFDTQTAADGGEVVTVCLDGYAIVPKELYFSLKADKLFPAVWLSESELEDLTHKKKSVAQRRALDFMSIAYRIRPDGSVVVFRANLPHPPEKPVFNFREEPNWSEPPPRRVKKQ